MDTGRLPLEDEFGDIVRKRMLGLGLDAARLGQATAIDPSAFARWFTYEGTATSVQARAIANALGLDEDTLVVSAAHGWYPVEPDAPLVTRHLQAHPSNGYLYHLGDGKAVLVDPARDRAKLLHVIATSGFDLDTILITHKHDDHCDAAADVARVYPQAQIVMHRVDSPAIGSLATSATLFDDDTTVTTRSGATLHALHTPGHTDGSTCYLIGSTLFTGDMLFAGSVGGAYGDTSTHADLLRSIRSKLLCLPPETSVMPGHGPATTIAQERAHNPFFNHDT